MRTARLVPGTSPVLTTPTQPVVSFDLALRRLAGAMRVQLKLARGAAIAAPQIGRSVRMFVTPNYDAVNPTWRPLSDITNIAPEGCLSFPGRFVNVERYTHIELTYQDLDGVEHTAELAGFDARVAQHETDHLHGVLFTTRAI